ncbi:MAG: response regulator transcription factor [Ginsengibacter sp.]
MISVAIIEDLDSYRNAMQVLLNGSEGFECVGSYENAEIALCEFPKVQPQIALVDINLPVMNGIELIDVLTEKFPETLCMVCSAYDEDEKIFKALEAGAHGYLLKSTSPAKILDAIVELKNGGSPMSNEIARKVVMAFNKKNNHDLDKLSARENEILELLVRGLMYKQIAFQLHISIETVKRHCFNIYQKLHVQNRSEAIHKYHGNNPR